MLVHVCMLSGRKEARKEAVVGTPVTIHVVVAKLGHAARCLCVCVGPRDLETATSVVFALSRIPYWWLCRLCSYRSVHHDQTSVNRRGFVGENKLPPGDVS